MNRATLVLFLLNGLAGCSGLAIDVETPARVSAKTANSAPMFERSDHRGRPVSLSRAVEDGRAVLVFYRGHW